MDTESNKLEPAPKMKKVTKLVPPDGGWGWMVLLGTAVSNIFNQSMLSLFSLIYGDALEAMGHGTQGAAMVLNTMLFVTNFSGPIAAVILKLTSARFVAVTGAWFCTSGLFFSGFSTNIWHLAITYGFMLGLGLGFIQNSTFVSINSYFKLRKSRAVGLSIVGTGIGQTLMPHVVRYLLDSYGFRGACMLLSGLSLHGVCGTLLIQPVAWHMKKIEEEVVIADEKVNLLSDEQKDKVVRKNSTSNSEKVTEPILVTDGKASVDEANEGNENKATEKTKNIGLFKKLYDLFDISLLTSPRFLNIIIGTALSWISLQNFSMLFPFFLQKVADMNKQQTANCMSAVAIADIVGRLVLPAFQDKFRIKASWMLIMTSIWIIVVRQILAYQTGHEMILAMSCLYGFGRSMVIVARNLAIAEHCRLDQVAAAVGLGMLAMGILVPPFGYFLGWIRDYTGSYIVCITAQNMLLVVLLVTWLPDMLILRAKEKRNKKMNLEQIEMS